MSSEGGEYFKDTLDAVKLTVEQHLNDGEVPRIALVYSAATPQGRILPLDMLPSADMVGPALRNMCYILDAWGIIQVSEAWGLELGPEVSDEDKETETNKWAGRIHEHPDRVEQAIVVWEHKQKHGISTAHITEKDGKRVLGEWSDMKASTGRLTRLLPGARGN